jgi:hypothetical protein
VADDTPNLDIRATLDSSGVVSGGQAASGAITGIIGPLTEAEAAAKKFGVSVDIAQAALDKNRAIAKSAEISALAASMRTATEATEENTAATAANASEQEAAGESAEAITSLMREHQAQMMKNVFAIHRLAEGFKDISLGGRAAGQGLMDISEAAQYALPPQMALYVVAAQVVGMLVLMATNHRHAGEEAREHAKTEEEAAAQIKDALDKGTEAINSQADAISKTHVEVLTAQLRDYLSVQKELIAQQTQWDSNADKRLDFLQKETKATQDLALAQLKHQELLDLGSATSDDQRAAIEADYKRKEIEAKGGDAQEAAQAQQILLAQQKQEDDKERALYLAANVDNVAKLTALQDDARHKADKAKGEGFQPDEAGSFETPIKAQEEALKKAREDAANAQSDAVPTAIQASQIAAGNQGIKIDMEIAAEHAAVMQQKVVDISTQLADLRDAQGAHETLKDSQKSYEDAIKSNTEAIGKLVFKLDEINSKQREVATESKTAAVTTSNEQLAAGAEDDKAAAERHWKAWQKAIADTTKEHREATRAQGDASKAGELPLENQLNADRDSLENYQRNVQQIADHARETGALGKKHADQTAELAASMKAQLDELRAAVSRDEQALRDFKQSQKTNAQN